MHQKSWHVWRMDNRLKVERDELQHASATKAQREAEEQAVFDQRLAVLRRRAAGEQDEEPAAAAAAALVVVTGAPAVRAPSAERRRRERAPPRATSMVSMA